MLAERIGMVLNVDHALGTEFGAIRLMIVFVMLETGMELPVLHVPQTQTGMGNHV